MMSRLGNVGGRLYRGEVSFDFVGRQKLWYTISGLILLLSLVGVFGRGLNFTVDFKGGSVITIPASSVSSISRVQSAVSTTGDGQGAIVQHVGSGSSATWQVQTGKLDYSQGLKVQSELAKELGVSQSKISVNFVGASWGSQISQKALQALIAFLIVIVIYLSIAFEWRMAVAALIALAHDIVITIGIYALAGFPVSPATVIGLLTILGYSLYDTVVVFDKVRENTAGLLGSARSTYSQAANLALNQTLVRSINTSVIALLPVAAILFIGGGLLGAGELNDLALVLFVGMLSGTYSSIFIATPVLADLKERDPQYKALAKRVAQRASGTRAARRAGAKTPRAAVAGAGAAAAAGTVAGGSAAVLDADDEDADLQDADLQDTDGPDQDADAGDGTPGADRVTAGRTAPRPAPGGRPGPRQQPRRNTSSAKRRPGGKKKRR
jgi:preprotein translocase subunit SecF